MIDSPIGDAEGRRRDAVRRLENSGSIADGKAARDITAILARLETAEQTAADGWAAGYRAGGEDAKSMIRTLNGANAELEARLETAERENKRLEIVAAEAVQLSMEEHVQVATLTCERDEAIDERDAADEKRRMVEAEAATKAQEVYICAVTQRDALVVENAHLTALIRNTAIPALAMDTFEQVFNQQRFAEDTDTDYFLRCFRALRDRASQAHAKLSAEVGG